MSWLNFLGSSAKGADNLPDVFPIPISQIDFVKIDVINIYTRILIDTLERSDGLAEENMPLLWDNCLASEKQDGLVTLIAAAMTDKKELYLVYATATKVIRRATPEEEVKIRESYKLKAEPVSLEVGKGLYITFKSYTRSDMVKFYSALEYCSVGGLWKQANISKSIQFKINDLRGSVALGDSVVAKNQAKAMAEGMGEGRDILTDAKDIIETLTPDLKATNSTFELISKKQSFYLGMPASYFDGLGQKSTLSDTGKADSKAVDRGLKAYFFSIVKPVLEGLFGGTLTFKCEDAEGMDTALKALETFDRTSNEFLSGENKTKIVNRAFNLDEDEVGEEVPDNEEIDPLTGLPKIPTDPTVPEVKNLPFKPGNKKPPPK